MASKDYSVDLQKLFLEIMLSDAQCFVRVQNIYNHENFDKSLKKTANFIKEYSDQYRAMPNLQQIKAETGQLLESVELTEPLIDWFMNEFEQFTKHQTLTRVILQAADMIEKGDYDPIEKMVKDAVQISLTRDLGIDYFLDPKKRLLDLKSNNGQISSGWPCLDEKLYGGFNRGELEIFAGGSGCVTADTLVEIIELHDEAQIEAYSKGSFSKVCELYDLTQPKKVPIASLMKKVHNSHILVSSPDGWVPVTDCVQKIKGTLFQFNFKSGKTIIASHDHLYQKLDNSWHYARDLSVNDVLLSENRADTIVEIIPINKQTKVYDLSVNHYNHRYYTNGICSHNSGKSLFMQNLSVNWMIAGHHGAYITLELSESLCAMRIDSMVTNTSTKEIFRDLDTVEMKIKILGKKSGSLRIKYMPAQSNVNDIRSYLKELQIQTGVRLTYLCVDYLDLLMPVSAKVNPSDLFTKDKYVSEELRNLAKEFNLVLVTASQLNRSAVEEIEFDHSHISGGISKINTADNVFGIFTSRSMREQGKYQLQLMKTRSSSGVGQKVDLDYDADSLRISAPDEQDSSSNLKKPSSSILDSVKTKSSVTAPKQNSNVTADVQSTKLKQMLADLKKK